ncbi:MAG: AraC family transcriptional regulator [Fibrobacteria bacterium]|jgi:PAS domain S-box-containing protein|nr:AraC family transcriptional regulator [Fibrobacteria bacterium]
MSNVNNHELRRSFLAKARKEELIDLILEHVPGNIYVFIKDAESRLVMINRNFWKKLGMKDEQSVIGLTDFSLFPSSQAEAYRQDDNRVIASGEAMVEKLEVMSTSGGLVDWYRTTKIPLRDDAGSVIGLIGITHDLRSANSDLQPYRALEPVVRHIMSNYGKEIEPSELAALAGMPLQRFTRRFKQEFQVTPARYLAAVRLNAACRLLTGSDKSILTVSQEAGFHDHSFFTKQFVKQKGMTPKEYRRAFRDVPDTGLGNLVARKSGRDLPDPKPR